MSKHNKLGGGQIWIFDNNFRIIITVYFKIPRLGRHFITRFHQQGRVAPKELLWMDYADHDMR